MNKAILIIETNLLFRHFLEGALPRLRPNFTFVFAASVADAKRKADGMASLHCLISDYDLAAEQTNGIQFAEEIKNKFPTIKVILVFPYIDDSLQLEAERHKIYHCIPKCNGPYEMVRFIDLIFALYFPE